MRRGTMARTLSRTVVGIGLVAAVTLASIAPAGAVQSWKADVRVFDDLSGGGIEFVVEGIPNVVDPAVYKVVFTNDSVGPHVLIGYKIPNGWTSAQLLAALNSDDPPPDDAFFVSGVFAKPGQTHQKKGDYTLPGTYGYFCPIETPSGVPHFNMGFVGVFEVVP